MNKMGNLIYPTYFRGRIFRVVNPDFVRRQYIRLAEELIRFCEGHINYTEKLAANYLEKDVLDLMDLLI